MEIYFEFESQQRRAWVPDVDVCERPDEIVIYVEMPGVAKSDVQLAWRDGILIISGVKRQMAQPGARFHCAERAYGPFRRELVINLPVDHAGARAELRHGLMRIYLPKREVRPESAVIPITD